MSTENTTQKTTEATLLAWNAQLAQVKQQQIHRGGGKAGLATVAQVRGKTGLEVMTALLNGDFPHAYMADTFGCDLVELGDGLRYFKQPRSSSITTRWGRCMAGGMPLYWTLP